MFRRRSGPKVYGEATVRLLQLPGSVVTTEDQLEQRLDRRATRAQMADVLFEPIIDDGPTVADAAGAIDGASVGWRGPIDIAPVVPLALLDKLVGNLARQQDLANEFVERVLAFGVRASDDWRSSDEPTVRLFADVVPLVGLGDDLASVQERLGDDGPEADPELEAALRDGKVSETAAQVRVEILLAPFQQRLAAATHFKPLRATNERVGELAFWAIWDWLILVLLAFDRIDVAASLCDAVRFQCDTYLERGLPATLKLGRVPFEAMSEAGMMPPLADHARLGRP